MLDLLRDPIWQFIGAALTYLGIFVAVILAWTQRRRKDMSWELLSVTRMLHVTKEIERKLEIRFDAKSVHSLHQIVVKIMNSGNVPIRAADYDSLVRLCFGAKAQVLTAEITKTSPTGLQASVKAAIERAAVVLPPILLNPTDWVMLDLLVDQYEDLKVEGRIVGIKDIWKSGDDRVENSTVLWVAILGLAAFFLGVLFVAVIAGAQILALLKDVLLGTSSQIRKWFFDPLTQDTSYRVGFMWGLITALLLGWFSRQALFLRAQILRYFNPIQAPATEPGPSPSQITAGWRWAEMRLAVLIGFGLLLLFVVVQAFRG